ncbi:MAG: DNA polymerase [Bacillota bacterium]|nr:DNA polymerase [Bacillota bacterium]
MPLVADFETTTDQNDCRVWAWGVTEIGNPGNFHYGNSLDGFIDFCKCSDNATIYFHNEKFDGTFIMVWLFQHGFLHVIDRRDLDSNTFTTLISDKGQFYSMEIMFAKKNKECVKVIIYDSLKILPFSVAEIAKGFNLPMKKGDIDYEKFRPIGHELDQEELDYLQNDVVIIAMALHVLFAQGLNKMTAGSNALHDLKETIGNKNFEQWFPIPAYDHDVRQSYKGGFTYLNPKYADVDIAAGIVLDVNSLYPWVMATKLLPYGEGIYFNGEYQQDDLYPLYITMFRCNFELKKNHIPTIQLKNNLSFVPTEYLTSSNGEDVALCLTSVDYELFKKHYNIYNIEFFSGWKFKAARGLLAPYIYKWYDIKTRSKLDGNKAMYTLSKLMQNSSYGKFALNPNVRSKIPYCENGVIKYVLGPKETRKPVYIPMGTFITAWARYTTITAAQKNYKRFIYADTDSLHLQGTEIPASLGIDNTELGKWKWEYVFSKARYLRQKSYIEYGREPLKEEQEKMQLIYNDLPEDMKITVAGLPERCYKYVTWENFHPGISYPDKLQQKAVPGGIVLQKVAFSINK